MVGNATEDEQAFSVEARLLSAKGATVLTSSARARRRPTVRAARRSPPSSRLRRCGPRRSPRSTRCFSRLKDASGKLLAVLPERVGFREVEIRNQKLLVNGKPFLIRGVNRHEHDPETGQYVRSATPWSGTSSS